MYQECVKVWGTCNGWNLVGLWQALKKAWRRLLPRPDGVYYVGGSDLLPPLDRQEERRLLLALRGGGRTGQGYAH